MKSKVIHLFLSIFCALTMLVLASPSQAWRYYERGYYGYHDYRPAYYDRYYYGRGYYYRSGYNCRWVPAFWANGYRHPAHRVCWYR